MPLPTGNVTFRFTDIEGSTRLWEADRDAMAQVLTVSRHMTPFMRSSASRRNAARRLLRADSMPLEETRR